MKNIEITITCAAPEWTAPGTSDDSEMEGRLIWETDFSQTYTLLLPG